ncbi:MAG TPA: hypothetical protein DET40_22915 [Lentisphaeria bacterium]|nr:MAG: hypothetical protein A2X45_15870 [Lentisphaerae bacterium GWF2_50_93]HCE46406.1 hypothetical protein [Lentisphaeria bacterium]
MKIKHLLLGLLLAFLAVIYTIYVWKGSFDGDEFQHSHFAWLIWNGYVPYVDFFEHHSPAYHLISSPVFAFGGGAGLIFVLRALSLVCTACVVLMVYLMSRRRLENGVFPSWFGACLLVAAPIFFMKMCEARPEPLALLCYMLSVFLLTGPAKTHPRRNILLAGLFGSLAVLISTKYVFAIFGVIACAVLLNGFSSLVFLGAGALLPCVALAAWLFARGALHAFVQSAIFLNMDWKYHFSPAGYSVEAFTYSGPLVVIGVAGIFWTVHEKHGARQSLAWLALLAGGIAGILFVPVPYKQTFLPVFPILAIGAATFIEYLGHSLRQASPAIETRNSNVEIRNKMEINETSNGSGFFSRLFRASHFEFRILHNIPGAGGVSLVFSILLLSCIAPGVSNILRQLKDTNASDLALIRKVESIDPAPGPVFDGRGLMFYRPHVGRHACMHDEIQLMINTGEYVQDVNGSLSANNFPVVIRDFRVEKMPTPILSFISANYRPTDDGRILVPGISIDRSKLAGRAASVNIPASGTYRVSWRGSELLLNGASVKNHSEVKLVKGSQTVEAKGFVDKLEFILVKRQ